MLAKGATVWIIISSQCVGTFEAETVLRAPVATNFQVGNQNHVGDIKQTYAILLFHPTRAMA